MIDNRPPPTVDVHAHAVPSAVIETISEGVDGVRLERRNGQLHFLFDDGYRSAPVEPALVDVELRLHEMDRQGIDVQLLSGFIDVSAHHLSDESALRYAELFNDAMSDIEQAHPDRFRCFATLPTRSVESSVAELARCIDERGFIGAEIPAGQAADASLEGLWAAFDASQSVVLLHPESSTTAAYPYFLGNYVGNPAETTLAASTLMLSGRLERFPAATVILVHGGGFLPYQLGRLQRGWAQFGATFGASNEVDPSALARRFFFDTVLHDPSSVDYLIRTVGADRVVVGTDYPFAMGEDDPIGLLASAQSADEATIAQIRRNNPAPFLREV